MSLPEIDHSEMDPETSPVDAAGSELDAASRPSSAGRIRVLLIAPSLDILGGQSVQATRLMEVLGQLPDVQMTFFPINPRPPKPLMWIKRVPYLRTFFTFGLYLTRLVWEARKHDILHIFSAGLSSYTLWTIPALLISRAYNKISILNYRDGQAEQHVTQWRTAKPTIRLADRVVTPSAFLVDVFAAHGIRAQSIFNIIETKRFRYRKRRKLRPVIMTNRILEPLYNVDCILRAFAIIQERYPDASLTIAHDGCCRPALEQLARHLQLRNTRFIGRVPHDQIAELYDSADIYLTSPNIDCMPGSLLECFAAGLPVVATKAGGIPYIARDRYSALLVDINDDEALAARSMELLEDEQLVEYAYRVRPPGRRCDRSCAGRREPPRRGARARRRTARRRGRAAVPPRRERPR
jgi:glycosyltransferase involved in cell wall biosynthesis